MKIVKWLVAAALLWLTGVCPVFSQAEQPKWDYGVKIGSTGNLLKVNNRIAGDSWYSEKGFSAGVYATRYFNPKWSLRGELLYNRIQGYGKDMGNSVSFILAPRYRVTSWLDLELGIEARKEVGPNRLYSGINPQAYVWGGAAVHLGRFEINLRYAPGFTPKSAFSYGAWQHGLQFGISTRLFQTKEKKP